MIAGKLSEGFLEPNSKAHFDFLEGQLMTSPNDGDYLCNDLTVADIMMIFRSRRLKSAQAYHKASTQSFVLI
jgi:glutathione S-transferase